ncbi:helicase-associated domain-containing protein [Nocardiopsis xinjiangensis]|uniref:helicase-associated domain-containing protein n=1 Tax=Nocardiopsis xinjiangensis TaxID=124285 RepID=UPI0003648FB1|nr:helicase-associated domain-containing protein [Nocardiopsis xinjiangensis]
MTENPTAEGSAPEPSADRSDAPRRRPPTFTGWLRSRSDEELTALLSARPDLTRPVPSDIGALAGRATTRNAVLRVLERLDRFTLAVLEAVVALGDDRMSEPVGVTAAELAGALRLTPAAGPGPGPAAARHPSSGDTSGGTGGLDRALGELLRLALVWPDRDRIRPVQVLRELLPHPAQLGPPSRPLLAALPHASVQRLTDELAPGSTASTPVESLAMLLSDPARVAELLDQVGERAHRLLEGMAWGPPNGTVTDARRAVDLATAGSPVESLMARALLLPTGDDTLTLPREVGLHLREGALFRELSAEPPAFEGRERSAGTVSRTAAGQAFTALRAVEELLEHWAQDPPGVLRNGGLGVRDLRRAAQTMEVDESEAALLVETAQAAGLVGTDDRLAGEWLPTREYDLWRQSPPEKRWLRLALAWIGTDRVASLTGSRDSGGRVRNALGPGMARPGAPQARRDLLNTLAEAEPGLVPSDVSLAERMAWRHPRRESSVHTELVEAARTEASVLGLTAFGALAGHTRPLLAGDPDGAARELAGELPQPLDHILVQGDMTAVAPGPLVAGLARELALVAEVESTGGATVYRFTEDSIRRGLDAGRGVADITDLLERHSRTPLPQALRYLVSDVGRRHGRLRAGTASSYLRCDEPSLLEELLNDRRADGLGLIRLAPTVVASRENRATLVERLRQLGYHPVPESGDGAMNLDRPEVRRADPVEFPEAPDREASAEAIHATVRALRAGDEASTIARRPVPLPTDGPPGSRAAAVMAALSDAARDERRVWIGYTDTDGRQVSRIVHPTSVDGGFVTAYDATRGAVHRFAVHRISAVAELADPGT